MLHLSITSRWPFDCRNVSTI